VCPQLAAMLNTPDRLIKVFVVVVVVVVREIKKIPELVALILFKL